MLPQDEVITRLSSKSIKKKKVLKYYADSEIWKKKVQLCMDCKSKTDSSDPVSISGKVKLAVMGLYNLTMYQLGKVFIFFVGILLLSTLRWVVSAMLFKKC